jgi:hypothetical protein
MKIESKRETKGKNGEKMQLMVEKLDFQGKEKTKGDKRVS